MKNFTSFLLYTVCLLTAFASRALDLKQSKFTQVVNDVQIISGADKSAKAVMLNDLFKVPDLLRTGPNSRAELVADDQTITRVGANTVFSFDPAHRTIDLQKGSLLFHSPKGKGGGTIQTGSATASVLGTTIVVTTTMEGGFKILVLEGVAEVKFLNGLKQHLSAGQMTFILPGGGMSPIIVFRLDANTKSSQLVNGFEHPLPSSGRIGDEITRQTKLINKGKAQDTGLIVGDHANDSQVEAIDPNVAQDYLNKQLHPQIPQVVYQPVLVGNSYRTIDGWLITPNNQGAPATDALAPALALSTDLQIDHATLDPQHVFLNPGPFHVTIPADPACSASLPNPVAGVFGRNLNINTRHIDMTSYALVPKFDFLAAQDINVAGSLSFDGPMSSLFLTAGGRIQIADGSTVSAQAVVLSLASCGPMDFTRVTFQNTLGGIRLASLSNLTLNHGTLTATSGNLPRPSGAFSESVVLSAGNDLKINGTAITGRALIADARGSITVKGGAVISAPTVILTAGNGILLDNVTLHSSTLNLTAVNDIRVGSATHAQDLSSLTDVNISGHTLVFENVNFDGSPKLQSQLGLLAANPNTRQIVQRGYVNFFAGVTYQHALVTSANQSAIINPSIGQGIFISHP